jgi:glycerophosphoryl diester phosphodiesterase
MDMDGKYGTWEKGLRGSAVGAALFCAAVLSGCQWLGGGEGVDPEKVNIAHRGASAYAPEHTLAAYQLGLEMGADYIEQDLQLTRDGVLICLHDETLERTTNVAEVFPDRFREDERRPGAKQWYAVDFTLEEVRQLDAGSWFDEKFAGERIPTFLEAIELVRGKAGIYPELKEPGFYESHGMNMVDIFIEEMRAAGLDTPEGQRETPVFVQSFSPEALVQMHQKSGGTYRLIQLVEVRRARQLMSDEALEAVATYAYGLGPSILILRGDPTRVHRAHALGLKLHPYTVNQRNLPPEYPDLKSYTRYLLYELGVDGLFTDNPDIFPDPWGV